ncbi:hypothetical protein lerEdw1_007153 [Lerista edwardsae]|nr:hypothetical protein lerEdw1_007153 [Lerista edwardsae]
MGTHIHKVGSVFQLVLTGQALKILGKTLFNRLGVPRVCGRWCGKEILGRIPAESWQPERLQLELELRLAQKTVLCSSSSLESGAEKKVSDSVRETQQRALGGSGLRAQKLEGSGGRTASVPSACVGRCRDTLLSGGGTEQDEVRAAAQSCAERESEAAAESPLR